MKSTEVNAKDAIIHVTGLSTENEIVAYLSEEHRKTVVDAANGRLKELGSGKVLVAVAPPPPPAKEGQTGEMTETKDSKAGGVEGTKSGAVTIQDVARMRKEKAGPAEES